MIGLISSLATLRPRTWCGCMADVDTLDGVGSVGLSFSDLSFVPGSCEPQLVFFRVRIRCPRTFV